MERRVSETGREDRETSDPETEKHIYVLHMASLRVNECSPRVTWIFGQYKMPFTDSKYTNKNTRIWFVKNGMGVL